MNQRIIDTPAGRLVLSCEDGKLCGVAAEPDSWKNLPGADDPLLCETQRQLRQYFAGERREFDIPLRMDGSPFDLAVWRQLLSIPFGEIRTYGQIAAALGMPKASRAVGGACSRNPLLVIVPCHRVIAGTGRLTGFAAGMEMKRALLALEGWNIQGDRVKER